MAKKSYEHQVLKLVYKPLVSNQFLCIKQQKGEANFLLLVHVHTKALCKCLPQYKQLILRFANCTNRKAHESLGYCLRVSITLDRFQLSLA